MNRKEAIEIIIKNYPHISNSGSQFESALRELIPELTESEGEKIRQMIERTLREAVLSERISETSYREMWAYLEKQKKQKPAEKTDLVAELRHHLATTPKEQLKKEWDELKKWDDVGPTVEEFLYGKPAEWSEEDKDIINEVASILINDENRANNKFEEDKLAYLADKIQSLRPQPHWKPSGEQMKALEEVRTIFHHHHLLDEINPILYDYEELMRELYKLM